MKEAEIDGLEVDVLSQQITYVDEENARAFLKLRMQASNCELNAYANAPIVGQEEHGLCLRTRTNVEGEFEADLVFSITQEMQKQIHFVLEIPVEQNDEGQDMFYDAHVVVSLVDSDNSRNEIMQKKIASVMFRQNFVEEAKELIEKNYMSQKAAADFFLKYSGKISKDSIEEVRRQVKDAKDREKRRRQNRINYVDNENEYSFDVRGEQLSCVTKWIRGSGVMHTKTGKNYLINESGIPITDLYDGIAVLPVYQDRNGNWMEPEKHRKAEYWKVWFAKHQVWLVMNEFGQVCDEEGKVAPQ